MQMHLHKKILTVCGPARKYHMGGNPQVRVRVNLEFDLQDQMAGQRLPEVARSETTLGQLLA